MSRLMARAYEPVGLLASRSRSTWRVARRSGTGASRRSTQRGRDGRADAPSTTECAAAARARKPYWIRPSAISHPSFMRGSSLGRERGEHLQPRPSPRAPLRQLAHDPGQRPRHPARRLRKPLRGVGGTMCGDVVDCRTWDYRGEHPSTPPKALIVDAILSAVYTTHLDLDPEPGDYAIPEKPRTVLRRARQADRLTEPVKLTGRPAGAGGAAPCWSCSGSQSRSSTATSGCSARVGHHRPAGHAAMLTYAKARCGPLRLTVGGDSCAG